MDSDPSTEPVAPPTASVSSVPGDKPSSATVTISKEQFDALQADVQLLKRGAQSDKDRAVGRLEKDFTKLREELKPVLERAATLIADGKSVEAALTQVSSEQDDAETRQAVRRIDEALRNGTLPAASVGNAAREGEDMTGLLTEYKLDGNDPTVNAIISKPITSLEKKAELAELAFRRASVPQPGPAAALAPAGGNNQSSTLSDDEAERLYAELGTLLPNPSLKGNPARIAFLKDKLTKAGYAL